MRRWTAQAELSVNSNNYGLTGRSAALGRTTHLLGKILDSTCTVLLTGETGTGKEVVSRAIHEYGPRRSNAFVVQNCAAFPEALLESELFGYCKGAFTGADRDRPGLFDVAHGGTLLLDEIGDMPMLLQAKLLRVLQEGEIRPLGANKVRNAGHYRTAERHPDHVRRVDQHVYRWSVHGWRYPWPDARRSLHDDRLHSRGSRGLSKS